MKRIILFVATNLAVILVASVIMQVLGVGQYLNARGTELNLQALLVFAAIFGFTGSFVSLAMSKWIAKRAVGAQVITTPRNETESWLLHTVQRLAREAGIGTPEVALYNAPELNAFATGASRNNALVAVSSGLLQTMSRDEAEAVLGHEITHVANGDMVTMALLQGVLNTFVIFFARVIGFVVDRVVFRTERGTGPGFFIVTMVAQVVLGILAGVIAAWFSRQREFRADAGGARLAGNGKMIAALERLKLNAEQPALPDQLAAFGIFGARGKGFDRMFLSHPPLDERIAALREQH